MLGLGLRSAGTPLTQRELEEELKLQAMILQAYPQQLISQQQRLVKHQQILAQYSQGHQSGLNQGAFNGLQGLGQYNSPRRFEPTWLVLYHNALGVARDLRFAGEM